VLFELMSSLKVNFNKSMFDGVNISESWLHEAASMLRCRVGRCLSCTWVSLLVVILGA
jgi:hypothetical protein